MIYLKLVYIVKCTLYSVQCTMYSVYFIQLTMHTVNRKFYNILYKFIKITMYRAMGAQQDNKYEIKTQHITMA